MILGASTNPGRYSFMAAQRLNNYGHPFVLVGRRNGEVLGEEIKQSLDGVRDIDTVTLYLNPNNQRQYYDDIISLQPKRIIFNPGAENPELEQLASENGIEVIEACTLVMLSTGQY